MPPTSDGATPTAFQPRSSTIRSLALALTIASDLGSTQDLALVPVSEAIFKSQDNRASFWEVLFAYADSTTGKALNIIVPVNRNQTAPKIAA